MAGTCSLTWLFIWVLRLQPQVLVFAEKVFLLNKVVHENPQKNLSMYQLNLRLYFFHWYAPPELLLHSHLVSPLCQLCKIHIMIALAHVSPRSGKTGGVTTLGVCWAEGAPARLHVR